MLDDIFEMAAGYLARDDVFEVKIGDDLNQELWRKSEEPGQHGS